MCFAGAGPERIAKGNGRGNKQYKKEKRNGTDGYIGIIIDISIEKRMKKAERRK